MIEFLKNWVINIVTISILVILLEILIPSGRIKKFVNLVSGFILIIAIINPFIGLFKKRIDLKELQLKDSSFIDRDELEKNSRIIEEKQLKQITELYRTKLIVKIEESIKEIKGIAYAKADVIINEDSGSGSFGEIKRVYVDIKLEEVKDGGIKPVKKVEKVEIGKAEAKRGNIDESMISKVEEKINRVLGVQKENIAVRLVG